MLYENKREEFVQEKKKWKKLYRNLTDENDENVDVAGLISQLSLKIHK